MTKIPVEFEEVPVEETGEHLKGMLFRRKVSFQTKKQVEPRSSFISVPEGACPEKRAYCSDYKKSRSGKCVGFLICSGNGYPKRRQPRGALISFSVFKEKVLDGSKRQTIRKIRKYPPEVGGLLKLYWHCRRPDCELLRREFCTESFFINIHTTNDVSVYTTTPAGGVNIYLMTDAERETLAKMDGFKDFDELYMWFLKTHNDEIQCEWLSMKPHFQVVRW